MMRAMAKSKPGASKKKPAAKKLAAKKPAAKKPAVKAKTPAKKSAPKRPRAPAPKQPTPLASTNTDLPTPDEIDAAWDQATSSLPAATDAPRGVPLVELVIATLEITDDVRPLPIDTVAALKLPNGKSVPPSLENMLYFDSSPFVD